MKKLLLGALPLLVTPLVGCQPLGSKAADLTIVYGTAAVFSLLLLIGYCCLVRPRDRWFLLLFSSVVVVNCGYLALAISDTLEGALFANRVVYLGSVFLPMSMLMIVLKVCNLQPPRWLAWMLTAVALGEFIIAASPGYTDIYYQKVSLQIIDGVSSLKKVYGPLHCTYLIYLMGYFAALGGVIAWSTVKGKIRSRGHAAVLFIAVFVNLGVWFIEQLVHIDFELLSVSYVITELFLLGLHLLLKENERLRQIPSPEPAAPPTPEPLPVSPEPLPSPDVQLQKKLFVLGLRELTPTERLIYDAYIQGKTTKDIMAELNIKENTLKFHNKNIYSKLGVSSRKQLMAVYRILCTEDEN